MLSINNVSDFQRICGCQIIPTVDFSEIKNFVGELSGIREIEVGNERLFYALDGNSSKLNSILICEESAQNLQELEIVFEQILSFLKNLKKENCLFFSFFF